MPLSPRPRCPSFPPPFRSALLVGLAAAISPLAAAISPLAAQDAGGDAAAAGQVRVFLSCPFCDFDYVRTEIPWVDWMRERADAQVHVLVSLRPTGGGGQEFTLDFIGLQDQEGRDDSMRYFAGRDNTSEMTRRELTRTLALGLARYAAGTPGARRLQVTLPPDPEGRTAPPPPPPHDPWDSWTFSVGGGANLDGESSRDSRSFNGNLRASRITEMWKVDLRANGRYSEQTFTFPTPGGEDRSVRSLNRNYSGNALVVRSVTPHLSLGARGSVTTSTFGNTTWSVTASPAVEYNLYPYAESTRRSLILQYGPGFVSQEYREETIFGRTEETRPNHVLNLSYATRQPWGDLNLSLNGSQYLHDRGLYNLVFFGGGSVNLFRGLRFNAFGNYALVRDQLSLPRRDATEEEVLLRQRQLATNYRFFVNFGLSYRFGSAIQNVVNPRFGSGGGEVILFF